MKKYIISHINLLIMSWFQLKYFLNKKDRLCIMYIFRIRINHSFIQINFTCVLGLIKDEKKINTKGNTNGNVTKLLIISGILWYVILNLSLHKINIQYMH